VLPDPLAGEEGASCPLSNNPTPALSTFWTVVTPMLVKLVYNTKYDVIIATVNKTHKKQNENVEDYYSLL